MSRSVLPFIFLTLFNTCLSQNTYRVSTVQAAPGQLLELIDVYKTIQSEIPEARRPLIIRHSQGDHWDLMVIEFSGNMESDFLPGYGDEIFDLISFHEEIIVSGPPYEEARQLFDNNGYFHVEMFVALAGKQNQLLEQRKMENTYLEFIQRPRNLIFTSTFGGPWDLFTLGGYHDLKHYAESADIPIEVEDEAAKKAGFKGANDISPYLRTLILRHNDTLGGKVQ
jgi:hypothetical protein